MEANHITVSGRKVGAMLTGGAVRRFKRETGRDFLGLERPDSDDIMTLAWCSLTDRDGFADCDAFCNALSIPELNGLGAWLTAQFSKQGKSEGKDGEKKS